MRKTKLKLSLQESKLFELPPQINKFVIPSFLEGKSLAKTEVTAKDAAIFSAIKPELWQEACSSRNMTVPLEREHELLFPVEDNVMKQYWCKNHASISPWRFQNKGCL